MLEYNQHLLSVVVPDSEVAYRDALIKSYNEVSVKIINANLNTKTRLNSMLDQISKELNKLNVTFATNFKMETIPLTQANNYAFITEENEINAVFDIDKTLYVLPKSTIKEVILSQDNLIFRNEKGSSSIGINSMMMNPSTNAIKQVRSIMTAGVVQGHSNERIVKDIRRQYVDVNLSNARTSVRTLLGQASANVQKETLDKYPPRYYEYVSTLDTRTSGICASLDGRRWLEEPSAMYQPMLHPNCRSVITGYSTASRPINIMTPKDKEKASRMKGQEKEEFMKSKIFLVGPNFSYKDAVEYYPELDSKKLIDTDAYFKKLGYSL